MKLSIRTCAIAVAGALLASAVGVAVAGSAEAATINTAYVGVSATTPNGTSCAHPGFNSIQAAINAVNGSNPQVHVCGGRYVEQLTITKKITITGTGGPIVQLPANPVVSTTSCETSIPNSYQPDEDLIAICTPSNVGLGGLTLDASWPAGTCYDSLYGIFLAGGGTVNMSTDSIVAAGAVPLNGCQGGVGIQDGTSRTTPNEVGHLILTNSTVTGYQKNGIDVAGVGSTGTINNSVIRGDGATDQIAQNGIEVIDGATGNISNNTVSGNECDYPGGVCGPNPVTSSQSTGVLLYGANQKTQVSNNTLSGNDVGIYYLADPSGVLPTTKLALRANKLVNNRYEGIALDQGSAALTNDSYTGGVAGLAVVQYAGQTFGSFGTVTSENMTGQSGAAVEVFTDNDPSDVAGKLTLQSVTLHGGAVVNPSTTYTIKETNVH